jgi:exodeoxyribonuclease VII small subunit
MNEEDPEVSQPLAESEPSFEQALARLELIVDRLEQGDLELETALADFEEGVKLTRRCAGELANAERRIEILVREGEKWIARPFESADSDEVSEAEAEEED